MTQATTLRFPHLQGISLASSKLIDLLKTGMPGDVQTDETLTLACGKDTRVGAKGYANLSTAIRHVLRNHGRVWQRIKGAYAIKCLEPGEVTDSSASDMRRIHRTSKRSVTKLLTLNETDVDTSDLARYHAMLAQHGTLTMFSRANTTKTLETRGVKTNIDLKRLLECWPTRNTTSPA